MCENEIYTSLHSVRFHLSPALFSLSPLPLHCLVVVLTFSRMLRENFWCGRQCGAVHVSSLQPLAMWKCIRRRIFSCNIENKTIANLKTLLSIISFQYIKKIDFDRKLKNGDKTIRSYSRESITLALMCIKLLLFFKLEKSYKSSSRIIILSFTFSSSFNGF